MFTATMETAPAAQGFVARIRTALRGRAAYRTAYLRTRSELSNLSARDLADIGMHACEIEDVARTAGEQARAAAL